MCTTCGCSSEDGVKITKLRDEGQGHDHASHGHDHSHPHSHDHEEHAAHTHDHGQERVARILQLEQRILARNDELARRNRADFAERGIVAWNLMSSPGSGKTSLLERTVRDLDGVIEIGVIEGDQATQHDAERMRAAGARVVQINTGRGCHLDAAMVADGMRTLDPAPGSRVVIENVGNLVCPALFDLGETLRVVLVSVTEGEDKPIKYPDMFRAADVMLLTKTDLLPYVPFDAQRCIDWARRVQPRIGVLALSALTGEGMDAWYGLLRRGREARAAQARA